MLSMATEKLAYEESTLNLFLVDFVDNIVLFSSANT